MRAAQELEVLVTTYLINHLRIPGEIPNDQALDYLERVEATFLPYGGKWLVLGVHDEVVEGGWPGSVVLMQFPDMQTAKAWYWSPEYQEIIGLRTRNVISDLILVDEVAPEFTSAEYAREIRATLAHATQSVGP
jgi:uncharacterized protein (DUF1330 family)